MNSVRDETIETQELLKVAKFQLEQLNVEINSSDLAERINRHYKLLIGEADSILDLPFLQQKLLVNWFFGMDSKTGVQLYRHKATGINGIAPPQSYIVFNVVGVFRSFYGGIIQQEYGNVRVLGYKNEIEQPFSNNQDLDDSVLIDFNRLIQSLNEHDKSIVIDSVYNASISL